MSVLAERLAKLSPEKRRLLERRLAREGLGRDVSRAVARRDPADRGRLPLTFGMQRLWFVDRLAPGSTAYNIPFAGRLAGPLDAGALAAAFREVVRRHEVLRTTFPAEDGRPVQAIGPPPARVPVPVIDLGALPAGRREAEAERLVDADPRVAFDLARGPMYRVSLVRLAAGDHWLLVTMPHIVTDAWSMAVLFRELPPLYEAARRGEPSPLPELPIQVADFALWQHRFLAGPVADEQAAFWKRHLAGAPAVIELPTDRPRPPVQDLRGRRYYHDLSPAEYAAVKKLGERLDATAFMVLLAAFNVLVWRWTGERDQLVGTPIATRPQPESHGLIGFFIDNAVLRTRLAGAGSFAELVARVKESALATFANGDLPFDRVLEAMGVARDLSRPPLVQLNFVLQNVHIPEPEFRDLAVLASQQTDARAARFELTVGMFDWHGGLRCGFEYAVALWDRATIARMAGHFANLLREAAADPERPLAALPMLAPEESRQLLGAARGEAPPAGFRGGRTVWELIEEAARRRPGAVAVTAVDGEAAIPYAELVLRVRRTAARLVAAGLAPEEPVAVLAARSPEGVIALLAAMAAGGAYLPLDPALPVERLRRLAADAGARLLLDATGGAGPELPGLEPVEVEGVRTSAPGGGAGGRRPGPPHAAAERSGAGGAPLPRLDPDRLAYLLYTSGSSGVPKGVGVSHGALATIVEGWRLALGLGPDDRASHLLAPGFDASLIEVLPALAAGARLEPIAPEVVLSGPGLVAELARRRVTVVVAVPSLLAALGEGAARELPEVRVLAVGGDALTAALAARWAPGRRLFNVYGPTEAAITATVGEVEVSPSLRPPPIGTPLPEVEAHVVGPGAR
ncbi:MAG TPA: condensation domain-containing protein, partial [Thermoanaerobaculia bacterium]